MPNSHEDVLGVVRSIFGDLMEDLDLGDVEIDRSTRLIDLGVESISLVYLVSEIQQHYGLGDAVFRRLRGQGQLLTEMSVGIVDAGVAVRAA